MPSEKSALIIIDVQNDFCPGGILAVPEGNQIIPLINHIIEKFNLVVATQDWHPRNHISFASRWGKKPHEMLNINGLVQVLWPDHCVPGTKGADFHPDLNTDKVNLILRKGTNPELDSYSGFFENDHKTSTGLGYYFKGLNIKDLYICGLATDYCVFFTAMDAVRMGFQTYVILDASRGIDYPTHNLEYTLQQMRQEQIRLLNSSDLDF
jgi:nicotinamidase/pyrazinamidase